MRRKLIVLLFVTFNLEILMTSLVDDSKLKTYISSAPLAVEFLYHEASTYLTRNPDPRIILTIFWGIGDSGASHRHTPLIIDASARVYVARRPKDVSPQNRPRQRFAHSKTTTRTLAKMTPRVATVPVPRRSVSLKGSVAIPRVSMLWFYRTSLLLST